MKPVYLIACSKRKAPTRAPARHLYRGNVFRASVRLAEALGCEWVVVSSLHGVLGPDEEVEPYNYSVSRNSAAYIGDDREEVGASEAHQALFRAMVNAQLKERFPGRWFVSLMGAPYEEALVGLQFESPMSGMRLGPRLAWLNRQLDGLAPRAKQGEMWTS